MKVNKLKLINICIVLSTVFIAVFILPQVVEAAWGSDDIPEGTVDFLRNHSDWIQKANMLSVIGHMIGWGLVKGLFFIDKLLEGLLPQSLDLLSFLESAGISSLATAVINDLVVALMVISIVFLGFKTIIAKEPPKFKTVGVNVIVSGLLIMGFPTLMNTMQNISLQFYNGTQTGSSGEIDSLSWGLIKDNTADIIYAADKGFGKIENGSEDDGIVTKNGLSSGTFVDNSMNEVLTADAIDDYDNTELEALKYELSVNSDNEYTAMEMEGNFLSFFSSGFDPGYFRFPVKFTPIIVGLVALCVAYIFTMFVFISTIIEIGIKRVVALFVFATDLESGQRTKMVVQDVLNAYLLIAFTGLSLRFYTIFLSYLGTAEPNIFIYVIAIVAATFILIKGSTTIMRYFGVDVGIKEGYGQLAAALALSKGVAGLGKKATSGYKSAKNGRENGDIDSEPTSINDKLKKSVNSIGESAGYAKERGLGGMVKDAVKKPLATVNDGATAIKDSFSEGIEQGTNKAAANKEKFDIKGKKTINQNEADSKMNDQEAINSTSEPSSNKDTKNNNSSTQSNSQNVEESNIGNNTNIDRSKADVARQGKINDQELETINSKPTKSSNNEKLNPINQEIKQELKGSAAREVKPISNDQKLDTKGTNLNSSTPIKQDINQGLKGTNDNQSKKLKQDINPELKDINSSRVPNTQQINQELKGTNGRNTPMTQQVNQELKGTNRSSNPITQQVNQEIKGTNGSSNPITQQVNKEINGNTTNKSNPINQQAVQRIVQQVEKTSFGNPEKATQSIIQELQNSTIGNSEQKQHVIQKVMKASSVTPEQLKQNVQQVFANGNIPQTAQSAIQKIIKEEQKSSHNPETVKTKVIQEIEKGNFSNSESIKQNVVQEIQKAFTATPQQQQQNIKQVIETETKDNNHSNNVVKQEKQTTKNTYFGKMFGEDLMEHDVKKPVKKGNRFNAIKNL